MNPRDVIEELARNKDVIYSQLNNLSSAKYRFRPNPKHWSMIEVLCHLVDEEVEDFRARVKRVLENPEAELPSFNQVEWVSSRNYQEQDLEDKLNEFMKEREKSIEFLSSLDNPNWESAHHHPKMGAVTAAYFLHNWLAHDYIHIRQLNRISHAFLMAESNYDLKYAGDF